MSWKESKVRLLPPPQALLSVQDRKPDIQDLFLLASQATALSDQSDHHQGHASHHHPQLPLHPVKLEPGGIVITTHHPVSTPTPDSAIMPPPPPPPPRPPASPSRVTSTSEESELISTASHILGKRIKEKKPPPPPPRRINIRSLCYSLEACCPTETLLKTGRGLLCYYTVRRRARMRTRTCTAACCGLAPMHGSFYPPARLRSGLLTGWRDVTARFSLNSRVTHLAALRARTSARSVPFMLYGREP